MGDSDRSGPLLCVERGRVTEAELAALTVVLLARCAGTASALDLDNRSLPSSWWRRQEIYQAPRSWR
ncbi:acyl-CoA carboxylase subunit epsilon [Kitasatospora sp. NBC_01302]|uniref:acyl-CoA carboxylase subunit epsilon n=1 Tax=Kitasatospora sp. NBC_01302 TaxID=2903575 RepID=UPI002E1550A8|nr:acyl-CoA carboxylase subunit epsilon [Kitasatospora sp. NBC_01302]